MRYIHMQSSAARRDALLCGALALAIAVGTRAMAPAAGQPADPNTPGWWIPIGPQTATIFSLERDPDLNHILYAGAHFGGLHRSVDFGLTWRHIPSDFSNDIVYGVEVTRTIPRTIYVATQDGGIYKSVDDGFTWTQKNNGFATLRKRDIEANPFNEQVLLTGSFDGVYRSEDGGDSWTPVRSETSPLPAFQFVWDPVERGVAYAATPGLGVFRSTDEGRTWAPFSQGIDDRTMTSLVWDATNPDRLFATAPGGVYLLERGASAWMSLRRDLSPFARVAHATTVPNDDRLFITTDVGLFTLPLDSIGSTQTPPPGWSLLQALKKPRFLEADRTGTVLHLAQEVQRFDFSVDGGLTFHSAAKGMQTAFCGALAAVVKDGATRLFVGTGKNVRAADGASQDEPVWTIQLPTDGAVFELTADPANPGTLYAGTEGDGVFKTTDYGQSWTQAADGLVPPNVVALDQSVQSVNVHYAATSAGVYVSEDGGRSWSDRFQQINPVTITALEADPLFDGWVYVASQDGVVRRSKDRGEHFFPVWQAPPGRWLTALKATPFSYLYALDAAGSLLLSTDQGESFTPARQANLVSPALCLDAVERFSHIVYVGAAGGGVLRSEDAGATFEQRSAGIDVPFIFSIAVDQTAPGRVYAGGVGAVHRTTDEGFSWRRSSHGLPALGLVRRIVIDPHDSAQLYAVVEDPPWQAPPGLVGAGVYRSLDRGETWTRLSDETDFLPAGALHVDRAQQGVLLAGSRFQGVRRSDDAGATWRDSSKAMSLVVLGIAIDSADPKTVYACTVSSGVFTSTDGAATWRHTGLESDVVFHIAADPHHPGRVFAGTGRGPARSDDRGASWTFPERSAAPPMVAHVIRPHPTIPDLIFAGTQSQGVAVSEDGGATWRFSNEGLGSGHIFAMDVDPHNSDRVYATTSNAGVWVSDDRGASWAPLNAGLHNEFVTSFAIDPLDPSVVYAGTEGGGVFRYRRP